MNTNETKEKRKIEAEHILFINNFISNLPLSEYGSYINGEDLTIKERDNLDSFNIEDMVSVVWKTYNALQPSYPSITCRIFTGASKLCILFPNYDYVLKIPFNGSLNYDYDDAADTYYITGFEPFLYAENETNDWNYCEREESTYFRIEEPYRRLFCQTVRYLCTPNNYPVYLQKKVFLTKDKITPYRPSYESRSMFLYYKIGETSWVDSVISTYGETFADNAFFHITSFLEIGDLHKGNVGYNSAGNPVIFDYSDFWG